MDMARLHFFLLICIMYGSAERTLKISTQRPVDCQKNAFFPLPTAVTNAVNKTTYLVEAGIHSAHKYCQAKSLFRAGRVRNYTLGGAQLVGYAQVYNFNTKRVCTGPTCTFIALVECMPSGGFPCTADSRGNNNTGKANVGTSNVGYMNIGHRNEGNANLGSDNKGDTNCGSNNHGDRNIGCNNEGQLLRGWDLDGIGYYSPNIVDAFATCSSSSVIII